MGKLLGVEWIDQIPPVTEAFDAICCKIEHAKWDNGKHLAKELSKKYPNIFKEGLGKVTKKKTQLILKQKAQPSFSRPRKIPYALEEDVNKEVDRLDNKKCYKRSTIAIGVNRLW